MKNLSSILSFLVGSLTSWCSENSSVMSVRLRYPPKQTHMPFWVFILERDSLRLSRYFLSLLSGLRYNDPTRSDLQPARWSLIHINSQSVSNSNR